MRTDFGGFAANVWGRTFLRHLRRELRGEVGRPGPLLQSVRKHALVLFDERAGSLPDHRKARMILTMCSLALASYRELNRTWNDRDKASDVIMRTFQKTFVMPMRWFLTFWLWWTKDPMADLRRRSLAEFGKKIYGASMEFDEEKTDESVDFIVRRCAFHQFFVDDGAPELTPVVCAWDRLWMDLIDRSRRPIRTERPTTISTGGDCCRFRFVPDDKARPREIQDVVLVTLGVRRASPPSFPEDRT